MGFVLYYEITWTEFLGFIGGVVLSVALIPQVMHTLHTKSTRDISYGWQLTYILGLLLNYIYFILVEATAAWVTLTIEMGFALWLLVLKIRFDGLSPDPEEELPLEEEGILALDLSTNSHTSIYSRVSRLSGYKGAMGRSRRSVFSTNNTGRRTSTLGGSSYGGSSQRWGSSRQSIVHFAGTNPPPKQNTDKQTTISDNTNSDEEEYIINGTKPTIHNAICMEGNVDLDICVDDLQYKDAVKFKTEPLVKPDTLVKEAFRGFHIMIDVVFTIQLQEEFGRTLLAKMCQLAQLHDVRVVHDHAEIFDGKISPPGFAVAALLDESHMSAHCYSDQGKLAFDVFTCGSNPDCTRRVARDVLAFLKQHLGDDAHFLIHRMPRFPLHRGQSIGRA